MHQRKTVPAHNGAYFFKISVNDVECEHEKYTFESSNKNPVKENIAVNISDGASVKARVRFKGY